MNFFDEPLGVVSRAACGLQDKGDKVDVRVPIKLEAMLPGQILVAAVWPGLEENGVTLASSMYVVMPF